MPLTYGLAKNNIRETIWDGWKDGLANGYDYIDNTGATIHVDPLVFNKSGTVYVPELKFERTEQPALIDDGKHIAYFQMRTVNRKQSSYRAQNSGSRYTSKGLVWVELYFAKSSHTDVEETFLCSMVQAVLNRPKLDETQVWFRNPRIEEYSAVAGFYVNKVLANFQFDEIQN